MSGKILACSHTLKNNTVNQIVNANTQFLVSVATFLF